MTATGRLLPSKSSRFSRIERPESKKQMFRFLILTTACGGTGVCPQAAARHLCAMISATDPNETWNRLGIFIEPPPSCRFSSGLGTTSNLHTGETARVIIQIPVLPCKKSEAICTLRENKFDCAFTMQESTPVSLFKSCRTFGQLKWTGSERINNMDYIKGAPFIVFN